MKYLKRNILLVVLLIFCSQLAGQTIYTKSDTIAITGDSLYLTVANTYRGNIIWQKSIDGKMWHDLTNLLHDSLLIHPIEIGYYRAKIADGTCDTIYSDVSRIDVEVIVDGTISIDSDDESSNIIVSSFVDQSPVDSVNSFKIVGHTIVFAYDTVMNKLVYIGYPGTTEQEGYILNAKETALYYCLLTIPNVRRPEYAPYVEAIKKAFYELQEVKLLEYKIEEVVSQKGYLETDDFMLELQTAINFILDEFENEFEYSGINFYQSNLKSVRLNTEGPTWDSGYHSYYRVSDEIPEGWSDQYNAATGEFYLKRNFYNSTQAIIGVSIGRRDDLTNRATKKEYIGFLEPWFPPNMLSVSGTWENLTQTIKAIRDMALNGVYEGMSQTDAYSKYRELPFYLKENEKDAINFVSGYHDDKILGINIAYIFIYRNNIPFQFQNAFIYSTLIILMSMYFIVILIK
jgi:hypothetical protein